MFVPNRSTPLSVALLRQLGLLDSLDPCFEPLLSRSMRSVHWWSPDAIATYRPRWDVLRAGAVPFADAGEGDDELYVLIAVSGGTPAVACVDGHGCGSYVAPCLSSFIFRCLIETLTCVRLDDSGCASSDDDWLRDEIDMVSGFLPRTLAGTLRALVDRAPVVTPAVVSGASLASYISGEELDLVLRSRLGPSYVDTPVALAR